MFATQILSEAVTDDDSREDTDSEIIGCLTVREKKYEVKKGETKIGRDSSVCAIVIEDFAVSKVHAVIESEGIDDTFIYDFGSTNQTKLGKKVLKPHCRYKLDNESTLTLGNITAKFTLPPDKIASETNSAKSNPLDELEDIFELVTQVTTPDTDSSKISVFEKPANTKAFETPAVIFPSKESSKNISNEVTKCTRLDSQETKTVFQQGFLGSSCIFNANTQCQLYEPQAHHKKCEEETVSKSREEDKVKSFLDDGQDDVLCQFMSLHSTKEHLLKEIKTEVLSSSYEAFDASVKIQPVIEKPVVQKNNQINSSNNSFEKDFLIKSSITSTPLISKVKSSHSEVSDYFTQQPEEEDSIKTQKFDAEVEISTKKIENVSCSQDEETQLYLDETLDKSPTFEQINNDEDVIVTQKFNENERSTVIPESEDFMATQIYDIDEERLANVASAEETTPPEKLAENSAVENNLEKSLNFTQRSNQDDFIETQVFEDPIDKNSDEERNNGDEEDFIATQQVEIPVEETHKNAQSQRESSPDLLDFENSKDDEDFISTQLFEDPQCQVLSKVKSPERTDTSRCEKEKPDCSNAKTEVSATAESSGDETESDLEIILDKTEGGDFTRKTFKIESENENNTQPQNIEVDDNDTNSSYIFEMDPKNNEEEAESKNQEQRKVTDLSDSDETDCEEIAVLQNHSVKQEPLEKIEFEETQVLTQTPPDNYQAKTSDDFWISEESPKFESGIESDPTTLETDKVPDDESTVVEDYQVPSKMKKTEVGVSDAGSAISNSEREVDSLLKRPLDSKSPDVVPIKKSKTEVIDRLLRSSEKKLLRLVQTHDIAQIQPSRTRNSIKTLTKESSPNTSDIPVTNEHPSSRRKNNPKKRNPRKLNGDIKPYLTAKKVESRRTPDRERTKEPSPKDKKTEMNSEWSSRILRSSRRISGNATSSDSKECSNRNTPVRRPRRLFKNKNDYFKSSCINIVFTGFSCDSLEKIITELGGQKADDLSFGEVVVADKVRRTVKFLCAVGLGLPITSPEWLLSCKKEQKFLNPWNFILKDEVSEEKYNFELKTSLERSKRVKLLEGFSVYATRSTKPPVKDLLAIVESCGGTPILKPPDIWPKKTIIVSCLEDKQSWPLPKYRNIKIVHYEFILGGVLRQKIDFKTYQLR